MIQTQRAYEINRKAITTSDQMLQKLPSYEHTASSLRAGAAPRWCWPAAASTPTSIVKRPTRVRPMLAEGRHADRKARSTTPSSSGRCSRTGARATSATSSRSASSRRRPPTRAAPARATSRAASTSACRVRCRAAWAPASRPAPAPSTPTATRRRASNDFTGTIAVTVSEVLPNGNLIVVGEKQIAMNKGVEFIRFSGHGQSGRHPAGQRRAVDAGRQRPRRVPHQQPDRRAEMTSMMSRFFQSFCRF